MSEPAVADSTTGRRQFLERSWVAGVVGFVLIRFLIAYSTLAKYGRVTVVVFGVLDIATAVPYAVGTARIVTSLIDRNFRSALQWGIVACASFIAPYAWLAWAGREQFPPLAFVIMGVLIVLLGANAVHGIVRRVHTEEEEAHEAPG